MNHRLLTTAGLRGAARPGLEPGRLGHVLANELLALRADEGERADEGVGRRLAAMALLIGVAPEACSDELVRRIVDGGRGGALDAAWVLRARVAPLAACAAEEGERALAEVEGALLGGTAGLRVLVLELLAAGGALPAPFLDRLAPLLPRLLRRSAEHADALALLLLVGDETDARVERVAPFLAVAPRTARATAWVLGERVLNPWLGSVAQAAFFLTTRLAARLPEPDGQLSLALDEGPPDPRRVRRLVGGGPRFSADELLRRFHAHPFGGTFLPPPERDPSQRAGDAP